MFLVMFLGASVGAMVSMASVQLSLVRGSCGGLDRPALMGYHSLCDECGLQD